MYSPFTSYEPQPVMPPFTAGFGPLQGAMGSAYATPPMSAPSAFGATMPWQFAQQATDMGAGAAGGQAGEGMSAWEKAAIVAGLIGAGGNLYGAIKTGQAQDRQTAIMEQEARARLEEKRQEQQAREARSRALAAWLQTMRARRPAGY